MTSAIFHLARKYGIDHLCDEARQRLSDELPTSLEALDKLRRGRRIKTFNGYVIECINLARSEEQLRFLPFCFARLNVFAASTLLNGIQKSDGTHLTLSPSDQQIAIIGIERFRAAVVKEMFGWLDVDTSLPDSCQRSNCSAAKFDQAIALLKPPYLAKEVPLKKWHSSSEDRLCKDCIATAKASYEAGRKSIWEKLPSFFGLPNWKDMPDA
jgi:hypothetical protein